MFTLYVGYTSKPGDSDFSIIFMVAWPVVEHACMDMSKLGLVPGRSVQNTSSPVGTHSTD